MIQSIRRGALVAGSVLCFTLAGAALAQPAPPPPADNADGAQHHGRDPAAREAEHAKRLSEALQLRPEQDGALHAFLDALKPAGGMRDHQKGEGRGDEHADDQALTTPQRLDRELAHLDKMRERMVARVEATKAFYAQLSPDQQRAFDAMGDQFGHGGHHEHGEGKHGPDGHGPDGPGGDTGEGPRG